MNIKNLDGSLNSHPLSTKTAVQLYAIPASTARASSPVEEDAKLDLSVAAQQSMSAESDDDSVVLAKMDTLKLMIRHGTYCIDLNRLSDKLIEDSKLT